MSRPLLVDLFCKAGGAGMGYHRAGFDVLGVDIEPQPNYPFRFEQADALDWLREEMKLPASARAAAYHASPPCQAFTAYRRRPNHVAPRPNMIPIVRQLLRQIGAPFAIENVMGAPLESSVMLCGSSFGLDIRRHRYFESNAVLVAPPCNHAWQTPRFAPASNRSNRRSTVEVGVWRISLEIQRRAMGIDWMSREELSEAIPPAYTEHLGRQLRSQLLSRKVA